jgi:hypothetical protein
MRHDGRMRGRPYVAIGVFALLTLAPAAMASQTSSSAGDMLLDDVGPGWSPAACPAVEGTVVGAIVCFASDEDASEDFLAISAAPIPTGVDPRSFVAIAAATFGGDPFATSDLAIAEGRSIQGSDQTEVTIVMVAGGSVFTVILFMDASRADAVDLALDVARRQQDAAGQPAETTATDAELADALDKLLLKPP